MSKAEELFHKIAKETPDAKESSMFGALCIKAPNGKAVAMIWHDEMVFKAEGDYEKKILKLKGTHLFTPMEGRSMGGWFQVPFEHAKHWPEFAKQSMEIVKKIEVKKKKKK